MSDDQDTTAPGRVNITIKRVEVDTGDDPDRFIHSLNKAVARANDIAQLRRAKRQLRLAIGAFIVVNVAFWVTFLVHLF